VLYNHIFPQRHADRDRGLSGRLHQRLFHGSLLIETIFSLDGLGLLGFESVLNRDYPVVSGRYISFRCSSRGQSDL